MMKKQLTSLCAVAIVAALSSGAHAITAFSESFDGGSPSESWVVGLFSKNHADDFDSTDADVTPSYNGHNNVGHFEDSHGYLMNIDTSDAASALLSFDYATRSLETGNRMHIGFALGSLTIGAGPTLDSALGGVSEYDFGVNFASREDTQDWFFNAWTNLDLGDGDTDDAWMSMSNVALPAGETSVWVAFWVTADDADEGYIDNITVEVTEIEQQQEPGDEPETSHMPEPASALLGAMGLGALSFASRRRRNA